MTPILGYGVCAVVISISCLILFKFCTLGLDEEPVGGGLEGSLEIGGLIEGFFPPETNNIQCNQV